MPGLSGLAVAEYLHLHCPVTQRPWVVLFTAAPPPLIQQVLASDYFDDLLQKPCCGHDYEQAIARAHAGLARRARFSGRCGSPKVPQDGQLVVADQDQTGRAHRGRP